MKFVAIPVVALVLGLLALPVVFASGDGPLTMCGHQSGSLGIVLATIRDLESGGDYQADAAGSSASGAYQFIDSTWDGYGGFQRAKDAPASVQDAKAVELVSQIIERHGGDIAAVPIVWYLGHLPPAGAAAWDSVPAPHAGNVLTPRQYQARWLDLYAELATGSADVDVGDEPVVVCPGVAIEPVDGEWAYPGPPELFASADVASPHHDYPAWDWIVPEGTPLYAVRGGTVVTVQYWPHNWWDSGCTATRQDCSTCGIGVTVEDDDGNRWAFCHGTAVHVRSGQVVESGEQLLSSGNTGRSGAPHLHLQVRTADGRLRCPQPLLRSLRDHGTGIEPAGLPVAGCSF
ncbi:MAG: hypothetical protein CL424_14700 [Acidimicrobiaceae bacterium]|nr:hypothetical protein [Acidimicrobiaceae bacterium]